MSTTDRLNPESLQILNALKDNSGIFIKLETAIDGNSEYMLEEIDVIQGQLESTPYSPELANFIKEIKNNKKTEQKIDKPSDLGVLYYIESAKYNNIKTTNSSVTNKSTIKSGNKDYRIESVKYSKLAHFFKQSTKTYNITTADNEGKLRLVTKATATLTAEQIANINDFNTQLQAKITEFTALDIKRDNAYNAAASGAGDTEKNTYVDAHEKAIILYEVCKELVDKYNALLIALRGKVDITPLTQRTDINVPSFDLYPPIPL
jgi:hypothetical protein